MEKRGERVEGREGREGKGELYEYIWRNVGGKERDTEKPDRGDSRYE